MPSIIKDLRTLKEYSIVFSVGTAEPDYLGSNPLCQHQLWDLDKVLKVS